MEGAMEGVKKGRFRKVLELFFNLETILNYHGIFF